MPSFFMDCAAMLARQADGILDDRKREARRRTGAVGRRSAEAARRTSINNSLDELRRKLTSGMISKEQFNESVAALERKS
ncbi:hypothetical protein ABZY90_00195 [Streptomyces sp. NPDC006422]|uniref:hypothetical protein n=1 Tax=unclassified Streptomyces TaxID=2593676 RepID=UPI0033A6F7A1